METELEEILKRDDDLETNLVRVERLLEKEKVSNQVSTSVQSVVEDKRVKLPRLEIQKFDGNVLNWSTFWDRFTSSIDDATGINEVEKFNYLLGLLNENAKSCISGLTLTSENYQHAKAILKERYANPQVIISAHMESLVKMPSIRNMSNISHIRKMYGHITTTVRNLKTLNINPVSYGALLIPVLTEKIPSDLRLIIARKFDNDIWDLETMLECFKSELHAKEMCASVGTNKGDSDVHRTFEDDVDNDLFTTAAFRTVCVFIVEKFILLLNVRRLQTLTRGDPCCENMPAVSYV